MLRKKPFSERSTGERLLIVALLVVSIGIVAAAERDIQRRSGAEIKGSKLFWRCLSVNALGALAYFRWGRRSGG